MSSYFKTMKLHLKSMLEYKKSAILSIVSQFFIFFTYYFSIIALFTTFNNIKGFTVYEVLLNFSIIQFGYSLVEFMARGIDRFDELIVRGDYDRILTRPRGIVTQAMIFQFDTFKIIRTLQSIIIMIIALVNLNIKWNSYKVFVLIISLSSSTLIFFGVFLLGASYCFFSIQGLEFRSLMTDGGKHMAQYPISIYKKGFVTFFTYVIPYALVNYYPLLYLIGKKDNFYYGLLPIFGILFYIICLFIFKFCSKRYLSVGS